MSTTLPSRFRPMHALLFLTVASAAGMVGVGLWLAVSGFPIIRGAEMNVVFTIQKMLLGGHPYSDPELSPFDISQYAPLFYYLCDWVCRQLQISAFEPARVTAVARTVSLVLSIATCWCIFGILRWPLHSAVTESVVAAAATACTILPWSFLARPDALLALFSTLALGCAIAGVESAGQARVRWTTCSVAFAILAVLSKQNGLAVFLFVLLIPIVEGRWRSLATWSLVVLALVAIGSVLLPRMFGTYLWRHTIDGLRQPLSFFDALELVYRPLIIRWGFLLALTMVIGGRWLAQKHEAIVTRYLLAVLLITWGAALVTALKKGADANYLDGPLSVTALVIGAAFASKGLNVFDKSEKNLRCVTALWLALLAGWPVLEESYLQMYSRAVPGSLRPVPDQTFDALRPVRDWLTERLRSTPEAKILSFELPLNNVMPDKVVIPQRELADYAYQAGVVKYSNFRAQIDSGNIRFVITPIDRSLPATFLGASLRHFALALQIGRLNVYEWRG